MRVKCIANTGKDLPAKTAQALHDEGTAFELDIGAIYTVYGIEIWRGVLNYLTLIPRLDIPTWNPAELFEITDSILPPKWYFKFYGYDNERMDMLSCVWGYKELALDPAHYFGLVEMEPEALYLFRKRREEIDSFGDKLKLLTE